MFPSKVSIDVLYDSTLKSPNRYYTYRRRNGTEELNEGDYWHNGSRLMTYFNLKPYSNPIPISTAFKQGKLLCCECRSQLWLNKGAKDLFCPNCKYYHD